MGKIILTGDRPTGKLHVGHYVGSLRRRVELQNSGEFDKIYIMIADAQALTDNADNPEKVRQNILEVALDYLSCGLDPEKSTIFIQSQIPELCELSFYYMNLVTVSRLQRNPTVKSEIQMRNFEASIPVGFFTYPISQAADITAFKATTVPVGEDQMPMIEQCKEIVHKFNSVYGETLTEPEIVLPSNKSCLRLPGIDGKAKMSKSLGNCIYLSDEEDIPASAERVAFFDTVAAMLAALVIIPAMATTGAQLDQGGPGLLFIFLPNLIKGMPGGWLIAIIFFVAVLLAGMTSLINLYEAPIATVQEKLKLGRVPACALTGIVGVVVSLLIQGIVSDWMDVLSIYICPLGAGLAGIMFFWVCSKAFVEKQVNTGREKPYVSWYHTVCKYFYVPVCFIVLILGIVLGGIG